MAKFKKGDRVVVTDRYDWFDIDVGDIGTVDEDDSTVPLVKFDSNTFAISENDLKLIEPKMSNIKTTNIQIDDSGMNISVDNLYPFVLNYGILKDKNKEENKMRNEVLELWYERQRNNIAKKYKKYVEEYIEKNYSFVNDYKQLIKDFEDNLEYLYTLNNKDELFILKENNSCNVFKYVVDDDKISYEADKYFSKDKLEELNELENVYREIKALLSMSLDTEYQQSVLIEYGIIDKKTKRMIANEDSSK